MLVYAVLGMSQKPYRYPLRPPIQIAEVPPSTNNSTPFT